MYGIVGFKDLKICCIIGVYSEERILEQDLLVDLEFECDFSKIAKKDNLDDALDYAKISDTCVEFVKKGKYQTLETLAFDLIKHLKMHFNLHWLKISIKKTRALKDARCSFVELADGVKKSCGH